jgi:hypothetical protein
MTFKLPNNAYMPFVSGTPRVFQGVPVGLRVFHLAHFRPLSMVINGCSSVPPTAKARSAGANHGGKNERL